MAPPPARPPASKFRSARSFRLRPEIHLPLRTDYGRLRCYGPEHVRKLLHGLGFSVQLPSRVLARANASEQDHWLRRTYPNLKGQEEPQPKTGR